MPIDQEEGPTRGRWRNWAGNQGCNAPVVRPTEVGGVQRAMSSACAAGRVRFVGAGGSWSPLVPTDGTLVSLDGLNRILGFDRESSPPTVRVECGVRMGTLVDFLARHGLALRSPTVYRGLTIGGAIATGSHGTGRRVADISDDVLAMTLVGPEGDVMKLDRRSGDLFHAAQVALGTFGAMVDVTLECVPAFHVLVEDRYLPRERVLDSLDDLVATHEFVELYWFPFDDRIFVKTMTPTSAALDRPLLGKRVRHALEYVTTHGAVAWVLPFVGRHRPSLTRELMALAPRCSSFTEGARVEPSWRAFHYQTVYPKCVTMSHGVPLRDAALAWERLIELVERDGREGRFGVNMVAHARFVGASAAFLSQSFGRASCDLEVVTACGTPHAAAFYEAFTEAMLEFPEARPHWGKHLLHAKRIAKRYPKMNDFLRYRRQMDPRDRFLNAFLEEVFAAV